MSGYRGDRNAASLDVRGRWSVKHSRLEKLIPSAVSAGGLKSFEMVFLFYQPNTPHPTPHQIAFCQYPKGPGPRNHSSTGYDGSGVREARCILLNDVELRTNHCRSVFPNQTASHELQVTFNEAARCVFKLKVLLQ
eukprot:g34960.t1